MLGHHLYHHFDWALAIKTLARSNIKFVRGCVQLLLTNTQQVYPLRRILADRWIDVFIATALPGTIRGAEVNSHTCALSDFGMARYFAALVVREHCTRCQRHAIQRRAETFHGRRSGAVIHSYQYQIACAVLDQRADCRGIALTFDQVALPITERQTVFDLRRANMNADKVQDRTTAIHPTRAMRVSSQSWQQSQP